MKNRSNSLLLRKRWKSNFKRFKVIPFDRFKCATAPKLCQSGFMELQSSKDKITIGLASASDCSKTSAYATGRICDIGWTDRSADRNENVTGLGNFGWSNAPYPCDGMPLSKISLTLKEW